MPVVAFTLTPFHIIQTTKHQDKLSTAQINKAWSKTTNHYCRKSGEQTSNDQSRTRTFASPSPPKHAENFTSPKTPKQDNKPQIIKSTPQQEEKLPITLASHTMILPSRELVCMKPSPPHFTQVTGRVWPDNVNTHRLVLASHTFAVPS